MPIYMDLHIVPGVNAKDVAKAHRMDVLLEKDHQCKCLTYWIDEARGQVFCLIDAPNKQSVIELHNRSHGLVPNKIIEVQPTLVEGFLGRLSDPANGRYTEDGLLIIDDSSYRVLLGIQLPDPLLHFPAGAFSGLADMLAVLTQTIREHQGRIASEDRYSLVGSFVTADQAVKAAKSFLDKLDEKQYRHPPPVAIHVGAPVSGTDSFFGDTLKTLQLFWNIHAPAKVAVTTAASSLLSIGTIAALQPRMRVASEQEEAFMEHLMLAINQHYEKPGFNLEGLGRQTGMSTAQLYRKMVTVTGWAPGQFLKKFRLFKAKTLLAHQGRQMAEVGFLTGFSSPSYFAKCFKTEFGLHPSDYAKRILLA